MKQPDTQESDLTYHQRLWNYIKQKAINSSPLIRWYLFLYVLFFIPHLVLFCVDGHKYYKFKSREAKFGTESNFWTSLTLAATYTLEIHTHMAIGDILPQHNLSRWFMTFQMALTFIIIGALFVHDVREHVKYLRRREVVGVGDSVSAETAALSVPLTSDVTEYGAVDGKKQQDTANGESNEYHVPVYGLSHLTVNKKIMKLYAISLLFFLVINGILMSINLDLYSVVGPSGTDPDWFTLLTLVFTFTWEVHSLISPGDILPNSNEARWLMNFQVLSAIYLLFLHAFEEIRAQSDNIPAETVSNTSVELEPKEVKNDSVKSAEDAEVKKVNRGK